MTSPYVGRLAGLPEVLAVGEAEEVVLAFVPQAATVNSAANSSCEQQHGHQCTFHRVPPFCSRAPDVAVPAKQVVASRATGLKKHKDRPAGRSHQWLPAG